MSNPSWLIIEGLNPEPWTAPEAAVGHRAGKNYVQMYKSETLRAYQETVPEVLREQNPDLSSWGDRLIRMQLYFWRRLDDYAIGDGKRSRRHFADATNLQKALEDELQGVLFNNDRNVRHICSEIMDQGPGVHPRILIHITECLGPSRHVALRGEMMAGLIPTLERKPNVLPDDQLF